MTIRELAGLAKLGKSTVAYALQDNPRVNARTRARVQALARAKGYAPNPLVNSLMRQVRKRRPGGARVGLAYLMAGPSRDWRKRPEHEREWLAGAREEARASGYELEIVAWEAEGLEPERLEGILKARGVRGVLLGPASQPHSAPAVRGGAELAVVAGGFTVEHEHVDRVAADLYQGMRRAVETALARGYRRVGVAVAEVGDERVQNWWTAGALVEAHKTGGGRVVLRVCKDLTDGGALAAWARRERLRAVVSVSDALAGLRRAGVEVPGEVGFVALDQAGTGADVTSLLQPHRALGRRAAAHLAGLVERGRGGVAEAPCIVMLACGWREGRTLPAR